MDEAKIQAKAAVARIKLHRPSILQAIATFQEQGTELYKDPEYLKWAEEINVTHVFINGEKVRIRAGK